MRDQGSGFDRASAYNGTLLVLVSAAWRSSGSDGGHGVGAGLDGARAGAHVRKPVEPTGGVSATYAAKVCT